MDEIAAYIGSHVGVSPVTARLAIGLERLRVMTDPIHGLSKFLWG